MLGDELTTGIFTSVRPKSSGIVLLLFTATLFLSAGLMFLVEPMVARMVLPRLGGSPSVWSTCLVFFQATLLLGYAYAHVLTSAVPHRQQIFVHFSMMLLAALSLPLGIAADAPPVGGWQSWWLLTRLALTAGPTVFAISATAPLLQSWFSALDHGAAADPYFLYAGSNAGSLLALLTYPLLFEPAFRLDDQALLWSGGFSALIISVALCAAATVVRAKPAATVVQADSTHGRLRERLRWTALAIVPSSLLLGVTSHIASDVASAPLLWVVPLAVYLLSFIVVFARRPLLPHAAMVRVMPIVLIPLILIMAPGIQTPAPFQLVLHVGALFVIALVCHGEMARLRPPSARLTDFYFFVSLGGVLGGAFNALLAPTIFPDVWEYPVALVAACLLKPEAQESGRAGWTGDIALPLILFATVVLARRMFGGTGEGSHLPPLEAVFGFILPGIALLDFSSRRWRFSGGIAVCLVAASLTGGGDTIASARSFFGVSRVRTVSDGGDRFMVLMHGTTMHGVESLTPGEETLPLAYYSREGPFGRFFGALPSGSVHHVGVIGLGTGVLACYATPGQAWTFYEIDPLVERLARDQNYFHFLTECGNHPRVVLGDARVTIDTAPDAYYDVLVLDAFSSDSIPMHLVTREALRVYLRKLAPGGRMLFHISSRTIDLREVIGSLAADAGLTARLSVDVPPANASIFRHSPSIVVAVARNVGDLNGLDQASGWRRLPAGSAQSLWTDQQSDLLHVIKFHLW